jgi:UDP-glucose 4-epimerase
MNARAQTSRGTILVTGGAGYIGSHVVRQLGERGEDIVVLDDLSTGNPDAVLYGRLVVGDMGDAALLERLFAEHRIETVMHFAAKIVVPDSVARPLEYYDNNTCKARVLLAACHKAGVKHFVFSSTAAVYGDPQGGVADESTPPNPINPYGRSKLMTEWMLKDLAQVSPLRYVILRYFNVAGADPEGRIGQDTPNATHLIKVACQAALGARPHLDVYGSDYPTHDGTCVRDYIHVEDLAQAHLLALGALVKGEHRIYNLGNGNGFSNRQVVEAVREVTGHPIPVEIAPRRPGDPAALYASSEKARRELGWTPAKPRLRDIVADAREFHRHG